MAPTTCAPCNCIDALSMSEASWRPAVLRVLCGILSELGGGGGIAGDGYTGGSVLSSAGTNPTVIKNSAGILGHLDGSSVSSDEVYVKVYDKATAPNPATDTPIYRYLIPGRTTGAGSNVPFPSSGIQFTNGISFIITSGAADTDATGVLADEVIVNYGSK